MNDPHGSATERARHLCSLSEQFLEAAEHVATTRSVMALPLVHLLGSAIEYQLKAYICAVRAGVPDTRDLSRLGSLAIHCGVSLTREELGVIVALDQAHGADVDGSGSVPAPAEVRELLRSISAQAFDEP